MTKEQRNKSIIWFLIIVILIVGFFKIFNAGLKRSEKVECYKWQEQSEKYPDFYLTEWQAGQCEYYEVEIKAPVEKMARYTEMSAIVYAYSSEPEQTDADPYTMATGNKVYDGAIACPTFVPFGTKVEIKGKEYTCEDRMGEEHQKENHFDIWMPTKEEAIEWGVIAAQVKIYNK